MIIISVKNFQFNLIFIISLNLLSIYNPNFTTIQFLLYSQVILEASEKELQRLQEQLASVRSEKETLEGVLFDTQSNLETTHVKKTQLEKDQQDLLIKQESLKGQISRLTKELENSEKRALDMKYTLTQQSENQETEFQQIILNLKKQSEDSIKKLNEEKVLKIGFNFKF